MSQAIGIRVTPTEGAYDLGASKFFGTPTIPACWQDDFYEDEIFFCQIRLSDIAELDTQKRLPHKGYLYIFLRTGGGDYHMEADVRYWAQDPTVAMDDFNTAVMGYEHLDRGYLMSFVPVDEAEDGTRLFGEPSGWEDEGQEKLLLQFDPLDNDMGFLDCLDGYLHFFFGEDEEDLSCVRLQTSYS